LTLEVVSNPRITPKIKARADPPSHIQGGTGEKAQHTYEYVSILRRSATLIFGVGWVGTNRPWIPIDQARSLSDLRYRCRRINLLDLETPVELLSCGHFARVAADKGGYRLGLAGGRAIIAVPTMLCK